MPSTAFADRREILGAWFVAGLALAALGMVPVMAARDSVPSMRGDAGALRSSAGGGTAAEALPLRYDAGDFADWLATRGAEPAARGPADADS